MTPRMSDQERTLFASFVRCADSYLEFGSGGSTCLAASLAKRAVTTLDSSAKWLADVQEACALEASSVNLTLVRADIGPTTGWGAPADVSTRDRWPTYHRDIWTIPGTADADLYMIDGRFRVACFMQILLHGRRDSLIMFHDYSPRPQYHVVAEMAQEIAIAESLSVFRRRDAVNESRVRQLLAAYEFDPS